MKNDTLLSLFVGVAALVAPAVQAAVPEWVKVQPAESDWEVCDDTHTVKYKLSYTITNTSPKYTITKLIAQSVKVGGHFASYNGNTGETEIDAWPMYKQRERDTPCSIAPGASKKVTFVVDFAKVATTDTLRELLRGSSMSGYVQRFVTEQSYDLGVEYADAQ